MPKRNIKINKILKQPDNKSNDGQDTIKYQEVEDFVFAKLQAELPRNLYYHSIKHTKSVLLCSQLIASEEGVFDEMDLLLLKTAALFHDMGHIVGPRGHEERSCCFVRDNLPLFNYTSSQIETICSLIMATKVPQCPQSKLAEILCDADLDYLGRSDFEPISDLLFQELQELGMVSDKNEWNKKQVKFLTEHTYFTNFSKENRNPNKQRQIERLRNLIN